jgi:poly(3-hydroxybutyrate) depolymerase
MLHRLRVAFVCSLVVAILPGVVRAAEKTDAVESALAQAGDNRGELEKALKNVPQDQRASMEFLIANMPEADLKKLTASYLLSNVEYAHRALAESPWKDRVPPDVFLNYVLPYAVVDERRDDWRKDFYERFKPLVAGIDDPAKAAVALNQKLFPLVKVRFAANREKANQSPYETLEAGNASCTGLSILLADVCRAFAIPARLAGTPRWTDNSGNHSWVEIWDGSAWRYTGAAEPTGDNLDQGWFKGRATTALRDDPIHAIYAARFERSPIVFPPAWGRRQGTVYAVNVTDRYTKHAKPQSDEEIVVRFRVLDKQDGNRVAAKLKLTAGDHVVAEGQTRDDRFDPNDHLEAIVPRGQALSLEITANERRISAEVSPARDQELLTYYLTDGVRLLPNRQQLSNSEQEFADSPTGRQLSESLSKYFAAPPAERDAIKFDAKLDPLVLEQSAAVRKLAWKAYLEGYEAQQFAEDLKANRVRYEKYECPYVVRAVGSMPAGGWPLVIAMHGGGGAPQEVNDSQWRIMQRYYRDQPSAEGYLYLALRAPNNVWNGFYDWYNLALTDRLIRQFTAGANVDPNKVYLIGYSHGGYGAFFIGPRMPDRFAAIHASAAAPTGGNAVGRNLRNTQFTFMVGEHDLAYNRLKFCREFDKFVSELRGDRTDVYPVTFEYKEGFPHSGLPDRDKIKDLYPHVRSPLPHELTWLLTNKEVKSLNWVSVPGAADDMELTAKCADNRVSLTCKNIKKLNVLLDERLVDFSKPLALEVNGEKSSSKLRPSLRTLCETLAERGDYEFMFATRVPVKPKP